MAFFQIQEIPSVFINTDYIERFQYTADAESETSGTLTIHFVSGETLAFTGAHGPEAYEELISVLTQEEQDHDHECE